MSKVSVTAVVLFLLSIGIALGQKSELKTSPDRAMIDQYCAGCHNDKLKSGGLTFTTMDLAHVDQHPAEWEKVIRKLRAGMMPPSGARRPDASTIQTFVTGLENSLDRAAATKPNPGRTALHRLNRAEYANSIRELLGLEIDAAKYLPPDDASNGFDNIADVLKVTTTLMDGYVRAAGKISRVSVGDAEMNPIVETYDLPQGVSQLDHVEGAPIGTRGGIAALHQFPVDGDYTFKITLWYASIGSLFGQSLAAWTDQIEISIDGERAALLDINPRLTAQDDLRTEPIKVKAGPRMVSAAFIRRAAGPVDDAMMPFGYALADPTTGSLLGLTGLPHLRLLAVNGPYNVTGLGDTPSRQRIFACHPSKAAEETPCARKIVAALARQAFRRPVTDVDIAPVMKIYQNGRTQGDFDAGIRLAVQAIIADPEFVFRFERTPATATPGANYRISDLELASRLSYFLWSSSPDEQLLSLAVQGKLKNPAVLEQQARRMLADPRSQSLAENFAGQWLFLRNLKDVQPDNYVFVDFDTNLLRSMERETELFFDNIVREDRSIIDLLNADYTFVNERLAKHYGIPNVKGSRFRRVPVADESRRGLLGHGSILTLTSLSNRTSPVMRGKWVMENILGTPPPIPPPNVPALKENADGEKRLPVRERMEQHRSDPACAACHKMMDPIGFSLENFDAVGAWRTNDNGFKIDASGQLVDGTKVNGPSSLRSALVAHSDAFVRTFTEKLLTYALGRGLQYYDMPVVRAIDAEVAAADNRFSSFVVSIVKSAPFQMRKAEEPEPTSTRSSGARQR